MNAVYIANVISEKVESFGLSWECLVGQAYDGASTMSGCIAGVSTLIKEKAPAAVYVHCWAHKLNLALVAASQRVREVLLFLIQMFIVCVAFEPGAGPLVSARLRVCGSFAYVRVII